MGSPVDLTLGCSTQVAPSSNGCQSDMVVRHGGSLYPGDYLESLRKVEEYLRSLEGERNKVEGFKRELPLCIQLLEDAIQSSKEKVANGKKEMQLTQDSMDCEEDYNEDCRPTLEEFMPLSTNLPLKRRWCADAPNDGASDGETEGTSDRGSKRPAWMTKALLWTQNSNSSDQIRQEKEKETEQFDQEQSSVTSSQQQLLLSSKERPTGAFLPFLREQPGKAAASAPTVSRPTPRTGSGSGLSLSFGEPRTSPGSTLKTADSEVCSIDAAADAELQAADAGNLQKEMMATAAGAAACNGVSGVGSSSGGQSQRKARRCWSPELHRRFVSALHQLGGCQIATPKQIRELMKVDGLTNDEVKSHLQKYRLHTRRPSPSPQSAGAGAGQPAPQLVVLGGIWVPPKYTASGSQPGSSGVYDPTQHVQQFLPQDGSYFACISNGASGAPVQMHHHHHHRQPIFEPQQAASQSQCSPQGPLQVTSQLSGATQGPSSELYQDDDDDDDNSGEDEEEAKSDSTSWKTRRRSSAERDSSDLRSSSKAIGSHTSKEELRKPNLNLQVACSTVQSTGGNHNTAASEDEVNQQQAQ